MAKAKKDLMCGPGDFVVYPTHGVGKVVDIETREIAGQKLRLFVVSFDHERMTLRVPTAKAEVAGLRRLSSRKVMETALTTLKGRARVKRTMWSPRAQEYEAKINSGDPVLISEVVRDLHRNTGQPDQSFSERQIYEKAIDRLACEVAAVDKSDKEKAMVKLETLLSAEKPEKPEKTEQSEEVAKPEEKAKAEPKVIEENKPAQKATSKAAKPKTAAKKPAAKAKPAAKPAKKAVKKPATAAKAKPKAKK